MEELVPKMLRHLRSGERLAVLYLLACEGSTPRETGALMVLTDAGQTLGTIGGGLLEAQGLEAARESLDRAEDRTVEVDLMGRSVEDSIAICGGRATILVHCLTPADRGAIDALASAEASLATGSQGWLCLSVPNGIGQGKIVYSFVSSKDEPNGVARPLPETLRKSETSANGFALERLDDGTLSLAFFIGRVDHALVFGAGHVGNALVPVLKAVGFRVTALDDRPELVASEVLPLADDLVALPADYRPAFGQMPTGPNSYVVIVTRGHAHDKTVLEQALRTDAGYVGMMGSKTKVAKVFEALRAEGFTAEDISRVHSPIGVSIGAETPAELAISIAAEMIQERARLRSRRVAAHG